MQDNRDIPASRELRQYSRLHIREVQTQPAKPKQQGYFTSCLLLCAVIKVKINIMNRLLDETQSHEIAKTIKSKAKKPFDNAYKAVLITQGAKYVQGFLVFVGQPYKPLEHGWIELNDVIIDPTLPYLQKKPQELYYFPAQTLSVKKLKAIVEESKEDYPEDDPLPIYGTAPYDYYGDVMLGGQEYLRAYQAAQAKCQEINGSNSEKN